MAAQADISGCGTATKGPMAFTRAECSRPRHRCHQGFTLVEVMMVIVIMALLSAFIIGVAQYVMRAAHEARARADIETLHNALQEYKLRVGMFPVQLTDLTVKDELPPDFTFTDPWQEQYIYRKNGQYTYNLFSMGADTNAGTADDIATGR